MRQPSSPPSAGAAFPALSRNQQRGSKPRCHLLTSGSPQEVASRLSSIVAPFATVTPDDRWMPQGFEQTDEATLPEAVHLLPEGVRAELKRWWLAVPSETTRTPNWDVASTCAIDGRPGLLLIEAKAHDQELIKEETGRKSITPPVTGDARRNLLRIEWALRDASVAMTEESRLPWVLSRDWSYQMSNRFAWAWKLTELGIPVVLVYLGFLNAHEMSGQGNQFAGPDEWTNLVREHSRVLFPTSVWDQPLSFNGQAFIPLIRSINVALDQPCG